MGMAVFPLTFSHNNRQWATNGPQFTNTCPRIVLLTFSEDSNGLYLPVAIEDLKDSSYDWGLNFQYILFKLI